MSDDVPVADDDYARPSTGALLRGIALIVAAVVLGIILLNETEGPSVAVASDDEDDGEALADTEDDPAATASTSSTSSTTSSTTSTTTPARPPEEITVLVANGSGVPGAAARLSEEIAGSDYGTAEPINTDDVESSVVYYAEGNQADAEAVAALLSPSPPVQPLPDPPPVAELRGAQVVVVEGPDLAGEAPAEEPADGDSPETTGRPATTSTTAAD